jgi:alkyl sulfatase BDS1-like metallo-beta-lactamase superfamily hydrolase
MKDKTTTFMLSGTIVLWAMVFIPLAYGHTAIEPKDATQRTLQANREMKAKLNWQDRQDFEFVQRGFIARPASAIIRDASGKTIRDMDEFVFQAIDEPAPATVNPSLWRQEQLNSIYGLFKVADRIYQVRGYDISNISIIQGDSGYIVVDPLLTAGVAAAAMELVYQHLPRKPVVAVIYSHSHADHFGGVKGVVSEEDVQAGKVRIVAPAGFMEYAMSENILAGNVMSRRASYMFGSLLPKNSKGGVGVGLGKVITNGLVTLIKPTDLITHSGEELVIDGVRMVFMNTPFAEAPVEMMFYLPQMKAFYAAEEANATLHNLYTLRGAQVRDALAWSGHLDEAIDLIKPETEVLFGGHHWPRWGYENIVAYLGKQGDAYKYIHDQTLRLANQGVTPVEIAEQIKLPESLAGEWFNRGYYGSVSHNVKAVYQRYLGWFDGNPANIHLLPPTEAAMKYVDYMGGADAVLAKAREAFAIGDYRWVAEVVNHVVFAEPDSLVARQLQADALEQLGYQAESGQWRNFYLSGAQELRNGVNPASAISSVSPDIIKALTLDMIFDFLAVRLNGPEAAGKNIQLNLYFEDSDEHYLLSVRNGVLKSWAGRKNQAADASIKLTRNALIAMTIAGRPLETLIEAELISVEGDTKRLIEFLSLLDQFEFWFNIVTP